MAIATSGVTVNEAADRLGLSAARVRELVSLGVLESPGRGRITLPDTVSSTVAAPLMNVTSGRVRQLLRSEELGATRLGPRAWAVPISEIRKFNLAPPPPRGWPRGVSRV